MRSKNKSRVLSFCMVLIMLNTFCFSQTNNKELVVQLADSLEKLYVFPDKGLDMANILKKNEAFGKYNNLSGIELASSLESDLKSLVSDKHLRIYYGRPSGPVKKREIPFHNNAISDAKILDNNVGYIEITAFKALNSGIKEHLAGQLEKVKDTKSIIIDLRNNGGGSPETVQLLASYFIEYTPNKLLNTIEYRGYDLINQYYVLEDVLGSRMVDKEVYILISSYTFSAGEGFAYMMQSQKRATIIGEASAGGAHPVNFYPMQNNIIAKIPIGRSINPITGTNWEGTGVIPDIQIEENKTLDKALELINN